MPIDLGEIKVPDEIPGFITHFELMCLSNIARRIPENKKILEIGSLFGRSAITFLLNSHDSVTLQTIDPHEQFGDMLGWEKLHGDKLDGCDPDKIQKAFELNRKCNCFHDSFHYFTKEYQKSGRLIPIRKKSLDVNIDDNVEVMFIDGDHYIVREDFAHFYEKVDGLIAIHDYEVESDWGTESIKSCMQCSYMTGMPYVIFPSASIAFFCKSKYWQDEIYKICEDSLKHLSKFGENYEVGKFFA